MFGGWRGLCSSKLWGGRGASMRVPPVNGGDLIKAPGVRMQGGIHQSVKSESIDSIKLAFWKIVPAVVWGQAHRKAGPFACPGSFMPAYDSKGKMATEQRQIF